MYWCQDRELGDFWLIDTPGFSDTYLSDAEVLERIVFWLNAAYHKQIQLTGIVYLHSIRQNRVGGSDVRSFQWFHELCGERALRKVLLVTSFWDCVPGQLSHRLAEEREEELKRTEYWGNMILLGARTARHYNTRNSGREIIQRLISLRTINDRGTHTGVQEEMAAGARLDETNVGRNMNRYHEQQSNHFREEIARLERELRERLREVDESHRLELRQQRAEFEQRRTRLREDQTRLHATIQTLNERFQRLQQETETRLAEEVRRSEARERELALDRDVQALRGRQQAVEDRNQARENLLAKKKELEEARKRILFCNPQ